MRTPASAGFRDHDEEVKVNPGLRAIETTGVVETQQQLKLDIPLPAAVSSRVRIIVLFPEEAYQEPSEVEWLYATATNPAFDFLKEPTEDIYSLGGLSSL
jgi:hypothetical protein